MRGWIATFVLFSVAVWSPLGARTVSTNGSCRLIAGDKYLGAQRTATLCREIERAIAAEAPNAHYRAEIKAFSPTRLGAVLVVNGRALPEHKFAVMDAELAVESMQRFARALAADVAKAVKK